MPDAVVYNVIFVQGANRIDVWTKTNALVLELPPREAASRERDVEYEWFAYGGFRRGGVLRYGPLVAHGTIRAPAGSIRPGRPPKWTAS